MIDIENVKKEFDKYVSNFNPSDKKIKLKIDHIKRVAELSKKIAVNLELNEEQIRLAEVIGFFHDIGRFKQIELYHTFKDRDSVNHAELGIKILYEDNLIKRFNIDSKYDNIIKLAVLNHNKNEIQEGLTDEEMLFAKIIRDADKLDIFYIICDEEYEMEDIFWSNNFKCKKISDDVMKQFLDSKPVDYDKVKSNADQIVTFYGYVYNLYFDFSIKYLKESKYLNRFADRVNKTFKSDEIQKQVNILLEKIDM